MNFHFYGSWHTGVEVDPALGDGEATLGSQTPSGANT